MLRQVDFDQLKIENQQFLDRIEEKNNTMIQLKLLAGRSLHELNQQKRKLQVRMKQNGTKWNKTEVSHYLGIVDVTGQVSPDTQMQVI